MNYKDERQEETEQINRVLNVIADAVRVALVTESKDDFDNNPNARFAFLALGNLKIEPADSDAYNNAAGIHCYGIRHRVSVQIQPDRENRGWSNPKTGKIRVTLRGADVRTKTYRPKSWDVETDPSARERVTLIAEAFADAVIRAYAKKQRQETTDAKRKRADDLVNQVFGEWGTYKTRPTINGGRLEVSVNQWGDIVATITHRLDVDDPKTFDKLIHLKNTTKGE